MQCADLHDGIRPSRRAAAEGPPLPEALDTALPCSTSPKSTRLTKASRQQRRQRATSRKEKRRSRITTPLVVTVKRRPDSESKILYLSSDDMGAGGRRPWYEAERRFKTPSNFPGQRRWYAPWSVETATVTQAATRHRWDLK